MPYLNLWGLTILQGKNEDDDSDDDEDDQDDDEDGDEDDGK